MSTAPESQNKKATPSFFSGVGCWGSLAVIGASLLLYLIACVTPAMVFDKETWLGIQVLGLGWLGIFLRQFAWFANVFWLLSLLLAFFRRWLLTFVATFITIFIGLDAFLFIGASVPLDEAGVSSMLFKSYDVGFYFWLASLAAVGLGAVAMWIVTLAMARRSSVRK